MEDRMVGTELITVTQLPVIEDQLAALHVELQDDLRVLESLAPTKENYKELKKIRAEWNRKIDALEKARKQVKAKIEEPYKLFENGKYKDLITDIRSAVGALDGGIKDVENGLRQESQKELLKYYEEYRQSLGLDAEIADARRSGIKVGLSDTMKSLKDQARNHLDKINSDLAMIDTLEDRDEILVEYRMCLDAVKAVAIVNERHRQAEEMRKRREADEEARRLLEKKEAAIDNVVSEGQKQVTEEQEFTDEVLPIPTAENAVEGQEIGLEDIFAASFTVYGTIYQLKALKSFLENNGYQYESEDE